MTLLLGLKIPFARMVRTLLTENCRPLTTSVWTPLAAPNVIDLATKFPTSTVTVYVPDSAKTMESPAAGMRPRLQFDALLQRPPAPFVHEIVVPDVVQFTSAPPAVAVC